MVGEPLGSMTQTASGEPVAKPGPEQPSKAGRWLLAGTLFTLYLPMQILLAIPLVLAAMLFGGVDSLESLMQPDNKLVLWMSLVAAALAALLTIAGALVWPAVWRFFTTKDIKLKEWLAWSPLRRLPIWAVPLVTFLMILGAGLLASTQFGPTEVELQVMLFSAPGLSILATVVVSTIVPVAEEFIFRGALYTAALSEKGSGWRQHIVPFIVTTLAFGAVHLLAGFEALGSIVLIFLLSAYLTTLRAVTGSVKASIVAHLVWNLTAAIGLVLGSQFGLT